MPLSAAAADDAAECLAQVVQGRCRTAEEAATQLHSIVGLLRSDEFAALARSLRTDVATVVLLRRFPAAPGVQSWGCAVLAFLASTASADGPGAPARCAQSALAVVTALSAHGNDTEVVTLALLALCKLAGAARADADAAVAAGALAAAAAALRVHAAHAGVVAQALQALRTLLFSVTADVAGAAAEQARRARACAAVVAAARTRARDASVSEDTARALRELALLGGAALHDGDAAAGARCCVEALQRHGASGAGVASGACLALTPLLRAAAGGPNALAASGGDAELGAAALASAVDVMRAHAASSDVQQAGADTLSCGARLGSDSAHKAPLRRWRRCWRRRGATRTTATCAAQCATRWARWARTPPSDSP
jgi:hypothetical protein